MTGSIELWQAVANDATLLERAAEVDASPGVSALALLRRDYSAQAVAAALSLVQARAKAVAKFDDRGRTLVADVAGIEQASGQRVATYKAGRFRQHLGQGACVADLCCGIGGDSMALGQAGFRVIAVDRNPLRAWMAKQNGGKNVDSVCSEVSSLELDGWAIHMDPARRDEGSRRRAWRLEDYQPGPAVMGALIERSSAGGLKLSPGVDVDQLPWLGEIEFISDRGRLVQAVLWTGGLAQASRRATRIDDQGIHQLAGEPTLPRYAEIQRYLYTFDAAVERAGLIGQLSAMLDVPAVHPKLGLLTSERVVTSAWTTGFECVDVLPWRPKKVKQWLGAHDGGLVEVKTRGKACDPDAEQKRLRGEGATPYTVFVLRFDTKVQALMTQRISRSEHEVSSRVPSM